MRATHESIAPVGMELLALSFLLFCFFDFGYKQHG
jgi:hypothetical protein